METKSSFISVIARRWWIVLIVLLLTLVATALLTLRMDPIYKASATYVIRLSDQITERKEITSALESLNRQDDVLTTYTEIAMSKMIFTQAAQTLGYNPQDLRGYSVKSQIVPGTNMIEMIVEGRNPAIAANIANTVGEKTAEYSNSLYTIYQLARLDAAQAPNEPVSPRFTLNMIVGAIAGLMIGLILLFIYAWMSGSSSTVPMPRPDDYPPVPSFMKDLEDIKRQNDTIIRELFGVQRGYQGMATEVKALSEELKSNSFHNKHLDPK
jgi:capsular polysaccharide biosynthesis protein